MKKLIIGLILVLLGNISIATFGNDVTIESVDVTETEVRIIKRHPSNEIYTCIPPMSAPDKFTIETYIVTNNRLIKMGIGEWIAEDDNDFNQEYIINPKDNLKNIFGELNGK